ncbi:UNVERIFIED_CONTAM: hypothetical protein PYX00_007415 [Menopon gallinae]|uniref:Double-stranded RNA-specific editase Adar n=1 Tax=Menopon gallinae TaxID=328185 RepID=A0AAW2HJ58_9NEOP
MADFIPMSNAALPIKLSIDQKLGGISQKSKKIMKKKKLTNSTVPKNALCRLNEMFRGLVFQTVSQEGPVHAPVFTISVKINDKEFEGRGKSKKIAKHNAAEAALRTLTQGTDVNLTSGTLKFYGSCEPTDFSNDISYKEVNTFDATKACEVPASNGNVNGLSEIRKPIGLKTQVRPVDKSPVMLLNELHPTCKYNVVSENALDNNRYTTEVTIDDQSFRGTGPSKKLSKAAAARSALAALHNMSFASVELSSSSSSHSFGSEIPQVFADHVSRLVVQKFTDLMQNNPTYARRKVLAGVVLSKGYEQDSCRVISVSTGTKCVNGEYLSTSGTVVNDSHAEIISRRCVINFLYSELYKHLSMSSDSDSILEVIPGGHGLRLKEDYLFHLFINTAPCGDSRIFSPHDEQIVDRHPNRKARGQLRTKIECGEGTIPVKQGDAIQTWDGVLQGERLLTMSCSDKIAKWNVVGIQGALLSNFVEPVYFDSIILGSLYHPEHLTRALYGRILNVLQALPPPYRLNKPKMALISNKEERQVGKPPNYSVNWTVGDENPEIVMSGTGKTEQNDVSRLAKCNLFDKFMNLVGNIPSSTLRGVCDCPKTYRECKDKAVLYQAAKKELYTAFQKANLGCWVKKPFEADEFEWKKENLIRKEVH